LGGEVLDLKRNKFLELVLADEIKYEAMIIQSESLKAIKIQQESLKAQC
jgi:hypothetical protein